MLWLCEWFRTIGESSWRGRALVNVLLNRITGLPTHTIEVKLINLFSAVKTCLNIVVKEQTRCSDGDGRITYVETREGKTTLGVGDLTAI